MSSSWNIFPLDIKKVILAYLFDKLSSQHFLSKIRSYALVSKEFYYLLKSRSLWKLHPCPLKFPIFTKRKIRSDVTIKDVWNKYLVVVIGINEALITVSGTVVIMVKSIKISGKFLAAVDRNLLLTIYHEDIRHMVYKGHVKSSLISISHTPSGLMVKDEEMIDILDNGELLSINVILDYNYNMGWYGVYDFFSFVPWISNSYMMNTYHDIKIREIIIVPNIADVILDWNGECFLNTPSHNMMKIAFSNSNKNIPIKRILANENFVFFRGEIFNYQGKKVFEDSKMLCIVPREDGCGYYLIE